MRRIQKYEISGFDFVSKVSDAEFTLEGMGLPSDIKIVDKRFGGLVFSKGLPAVVEETFDDMLKQPLVQEVLAPVDTVSQTTDNQDKPGKEPNANTSLNTTSETGGERNILGLRPIYVFGFALGLGILIALGVLIIRRNRSQVGGVK